MPSKARRDRTAVALTTGTGSSSMVIVYWMSKRDNQRRAKMKQLRRRRHRMAASHHAEHQSTHLHYFSTRGRPPRAALSVTSINHTDRSLPLHPRTTRHPSFLSGLLTGTRRCSLASSSQHLPNATRRFSASRRLCGYRRCRKHEHTTCTRMIKDPLSPPPPPPPPVAATPPPSLPCPCEEPEAVAGSSGVAGCCSFAEAAAA